MKRLLSGIKIVIRMIASKLGKSRLPAMRETGIDKIYQGSHPDNRTIREEGMPSLKCLIHPILVQSLLIALLIMSRKVVGRNAPTGSRSSWC